MTAITEQTLFVIITATCYFAHAEYNLIELSYNWSQQVVNNISESAMSNSNKPIKFFHLRKLAKQLMLTGAFMIEVTKTITVNFMKAKILLVAQWRENCVNWKKK